MRQVSLLGFFLVVLFAVDAKAQNSGAIQPATEESGEVGEEGEDQTPSQRRESAIILPGLRFAPAIGVHPGRAETVKFDCDLALALLVGFSPGELIVGIVTELGYAYHHGDEVGGHYGTLMLGLTVGRVVAGTAFSTLILGRREDLFDIGVRAGLRLDALMGVLSLEVAYERRMGDAGLLQSAHIGFSIDFVRAIAAVLVVMAFNRPGRAARGFGRWLIRRSN